MFLKKISRFIKNVLFFRFPLYSRSSIPTKPVKYAVNLLNQNIAQLCFDITGIHCDMRATIDNLLNIFATLVQIEQNKRETNVHKRSLALKYFTTNEINNCDEIDAQQYHNNHSHQDLRFNSSQMSIKNGEQDDNSLSKSHSSVDMDHMIPPTTIIHHHLHQNVPVFPLTEKFLHAPRLDAHPIDMHGGRSVLTASNLQRFVFKLFVFVVFFYFLLKTFLQKLSICWLLYGQ